MKFIHLTDTHVIAPGQTLFGLDPSERLEAAVDSINAEHGDAEFVVLTGDMTHWGDPAAYTAFRAGIERLRMPVHLMVGNHDEGAGLRLAFPDLARDENGFVQTVFDTPHARCILLDTKAQGTHAGAYCAERRAWLETQLRNAPGQVLLFMHHPPLALGVPMMDRIMLQDSDLFHEVLIPHVPRIRHLFFGHLHRPVFGNWRGISFSCMRGLAHQVALEMQGSEAGVIGNLEPPAYGVVLLSDDAVVVHMHDFTDRSRRFPLSEARRGIGGA